MDLDEAMNAAAEKLSGADPEADAAAAVPSGAPDGAPASPAPESAAADRARDDAGRFAKASEKPANKKPQAAPQGDVHGAAQKAPPPGPGKAEGADTSPAPSAEPVKPAEQPLRLPNSWKPAAREALAKASREVQEEAIRIDREVRQVMQESAEARKMAETVQRTLAPYETVARANGMDAMQYAGSVLQTAAMLQMGTPAQRAQVVAQVIATYGVDVEAVNAAMQGAGPGAAPRQAQPQPDVSALVRQEFERARVEQERSQAAQAWQSFQATQPEFLEDVKEEMAELLTVAARRGQNLTYQQAYDRACKLNEHVQQVLEQRKAADALKAQTASTQSAKAAAVSIRSQPAAPVRAKPKGLDQAMAAAREKLGL